MKIKVFRVIFSFLLLTTPLMFSINNAHAVNDYVVVEESRINLSPRHITRCNLDAPEIKKYLIERIELSKALPKEVIEYMKEKENCVNFFTLKKKLFNYRKDILLYIWIPCDAKKSLGSGTMYILPLNYENHKRGCNM